MEIPRMECVFFWSRHRFWSYAVFPPAVRLFLLGQRSGFRDSSARVFGPPAPLCGSFQARLGLPKFWFPVGFGFDHLEQLWEDYNFRESNKFQRFTRDLEGGTRNPFSHRRKHRPPTRFGFRHMIVPSRFHGFQSENRTSFGPRRRRQTPGSLVPPFSSSARCPSAPGAAGAAS